MKLRIITLAAALGIAAAACSSTPVSSNSPSAPAPTASPTTIPKIITQQDKVDALVEVMQDKYPGASRKQVLETAQMACDAVDESGSIAATFVGIMEDNSIDAELAGDMSYAIGVAVPVLCPEYLAELERLTK